MSHKKTVYIASPYTIGDTEEHIRRSIQVSNELADAGFIPFNPLLVHYWHLEYPRSYEYWCDYTMEWLRRCDIVLRLDGESKGADAEVKEANRLALPVYYSTLGVIQNET